MRGCLTFLVGIVLGAVLIGIWWQRTPLTVPGTQAADVQATIADGYLARRLEEQVAGAGGFSGMITHVTVQSSPPSTLVLGADASIGPLTAPVSLQVAPQAANGALQIQVIQANVGAVPVSGPLVDALLRAINQRSVQVLGSGARIVGVKVVPGGLEIDANFG